MKIQTVYCHFLELLMIDATYKLTELHMHLFIFLVVHGNGNSKIVAIRLTTEESEVALQKLAAILNVTMKLGWIHTNVNYTDKDLTEQPNSLLFAVNCAKGFSVSSRNGWL